MTIATRPVSVMEPGRSLARFLICLAQSDGLASHAAELAQQHCRSSPHVAKAFEYAMKSNVPAGTTAGSGWADSLAQYGIGAEALMALQSASIFGRVSPVLRRGPFRTRFARDTTSGAGSAWKQEGQPRPLRRFTTDTLTIEVATASTVIAVTRELLRFSAVAEAALTTAVINAVAKFVDEQFLDPSVVATAAHPASITNGGAVVTSSGATAANIIADLSSMIAAIQSPGDSLRWIMKPTTYFAICAKLAGVGCPVPPGFLLNVPVVLGSTSPQQITLVDGAAVIAAWDDTMDFDLTTQAAIEMLDSALQQDATTGAGAVLVSLLQTNSAAIRADWIVNWQPAYIGAGSPTVNAGVVYMTVSY